MAIALVTCRVKPEPDPDEAPLAAALEARGVRVEIAAWDDPTIDWGRYAVSVLRSTWNYIHHLDAFLAWLTRVEPLTRLLNPPPLVRWNLQKSYLRELSVRGVPIVPTAWIPRDGAVDLAALARSHRWTDVVIKPVVGAASFATQRFAGARLAEGTAFLHEQTKLREMMVQPYLSSVDGYGERSVMWLDGAFTHAVRKRPRFGGGHEDVSEARPIADDERALAERIVAPFIRRDLLYARVDLARDAGGAPVLMELELAEPSLFLAQSPAALARFADAIAGRAAC